MAGPLQCRRVLDLACGTGDLALLASAAGADVTAVDITPRMIALARVKARARGARARFLVGDMTSLPLPDACVDVVTTGYGLRNVPDLDAALREIHRVLKPGGRLLSLDFNRPASAPLRAAYHAYLTVVGSAVGWALHGDPDTYRYIPESIRLYPGAPAVVNRLRQAGFGRARWHPVLGGLLAIHDAESGVTPCAVDVPALAYFSRSRLKSNSGSPEKWSGAVRAPRRLPAGINCSRRWGVAGAARRRAAGRGLLARALGNCLEPDDARVDGRVAVGPVEVRCTAGADRVWRRRSRCRAVVARPRRAIHRRGRPWRRRHLD